MGVGRREEIGDAPYTLQPTPCTPLPFLRTIIVSPIALPHSHPYLARPMPASFESFGRGPMWEAEGGETSPTLLEQPQLQPITAGFRGKVAVVTGGATGLGRCPGRKHSEYHKARTSTEKSVRRIRAASVLVERRC